MKKVLCIVFALLLTLALLVGAAACSASKNMSDPRAAEENAMKSDAANGGVTKVILTTDRMMVYTVELDLSVANYDQAAKEIRTALDEAGGYEQSSSTSQSGYYKFTLRVPTQKLNEFLEKVGKSGTVEEQVVSGRDITDSYVYAENERDALIGKKAAFEALAEKAETFDEQLKIQEKILEVAAEIDHYNDKLSDYKKESDYSTVNIDLYEEGTYEEPGFWESLGNVFLGSGKSIGSVIGFLLTVLVAIIPYALLVGVIIGIIILIKFLVCRGRKKVFKIFGHVVKDYSENAEATEQEQPKTKEATEKEKTTDDQQE